MSVTRCSACSYCQNQRHSLFYVASEHVKLRSLEGLVSCRLGPQLQALNIKDGLDVTLVLDIIGTRCKMSARDASDQGHAFQAPQATQLKLIDLSDADIGGSELICSGPKDWRSTRGSLGNDQIPYYAYHI